MAKRKAASAAVAKATGSTIPAELVTQAAVVNGAKTGKDAVPAGRDWSKAVDELAHNEAGIILEIIQRNGTRMGTWVKFGELLQGMNDDERKKSIARYKATVRTDLIKAACEAAKIEYKPEVFAEKKDVWPAAIIDAYDMSISKRLSETSRAMDAYRYHFTPTLQILSGKGTYADKLKQLPKTNRGRKQGGANANKGDKPKDETPPQFSSADKVNAATRQTEEKIAEMGRASVATLGNFVQHTNADGIVEVLRHLVPKGKALSDYKTDPHFRILMDATGNAISTYLAAVSAEAGAAPEHSKAA